jgi:ABC-2 type transport system permease protein
MSTQSLSLRQSFRLYRLETQFEILKTLRMPAYVLPTLLFPAFFYLLFGVAFGGDRPVGNTTVAGYLIATYGVFGVIGASMFAFGVGVAVERGQGWLRLKRTSPMPPAAYLLARVFTSVLFSALVITMLCLMGSTLAGVRLEPMQWLMMAAIQIAGAIPFCAAGLAVGFWAGPNSAPGIVNLIYLPMAFASGLWIPYEMLPPVIRSVSPFLPPFHLARLSLAAIGSGDGSSPMLHVAVLVLTTVVCLGLAAVGSRRENGKTWG